MAEPLRVITQVESWNQEASAHTIEMLEDWLERAKAGEVVAVAVVGECVDGATISGFTRPRSRSQMLGVLSHLSYRINRDWDDEDR